MRRATAATEDEVKQAIEALSRANLLRLKHFAVWRLCGLGRAASGRTWQDLLHEAIVRTLAGAMTNGNGRLWYKDIDFVVHLQGVMRSISSHWKRDFDEQEAHLESEIETSSEAEGDSASLLDRAPSNDLCLERRLLACELLREFKHRYPAELTVIQVFDGFCKELRPSEIMRSAQLSRSDYQRALKRLRGYLREVGLAPTGVWERRSKRD